MRKLYMLSCLFCVDNKLITHIAQASEIQNTQDLTITIGTQTLKATASQNLINLGNLTVNGASISGIEASGGGIGENKASIIVKAQKYTSAMKALTSSQIINSGTIIHYGDGVNTSNAMLAQNGGNATNSGKIEVYGKNASAMNASGTSATRSQVTNSSSGVIYTYELSNGLKIDKKSDGYNQGIIFVNSSNSAGIILNGDASNAPNATNSGTIYVSGKSSTGIQANAYGNGVNDNIVEVKADRYTSAMKATGTQATITNKKTIIHYGDGVNTSNAMLAQNGGNASNSGEIEVYGKNTSAISISNGTATNSGVIKNYALTNGMKVEAQSLGENSGKILSYGNNAVVLNNGFFINSGEIQAFNGVAIASSTNTNNAILCKGGTINGRVNGSSGVELFYLANNASNIQAQQYEFLGVYGNQTLQNSLISLHHHADTATFKAQADQKFASSLPTSTTGNLTLQNAIISLDLGDNPNQSFSLLTLKSLSLDEKSIISLDSRDGSNDFNLSKIIGVKNANFQSKSTSIIWDYHQNSNKEWIAHRTAYQDVLEDNKLSNFAQTIQSLKASNADLNLFALNAETLSSKKDFTTAMAELSGSLHGYVLDIASMSSHSFAQTLDQQAKQSDFTRTLETGKSTHRIYTYVNGATLTSDMDVTHSEIGAYGIIENVASPQSKLGFAFGGSISEAKFNEEKSGKSLTQNLYVGAYYNYDFFDFLSISSNARVGVSYVNTERNISFGNVSKSFSAQYPIYSFGLGVTLNSYYTLDYWRFGLFAGVDYARLTQGNLYEDQSPSSSVSGVAVNSSGSVNEESYNSAIMKAGVSIENIGYLFSKKYALGLRLQYQSELGDIKKKRLRLQGLKDQYSFETLDLTNMLGYGIYANYYFTPYLSLNTDLKGTYAKEINSFLFSLGLAYKFDSVENILCAYQEPLETRWRGNVSLILETEDNSDRVYFNYLGEKSSGDYITSTRFIPKLILNLTDTQTNLSYYYEGFYSDNKMFQGLHTNEAKQYSTRAHFEMRWSNTIDFFTQSYSIGYRNEINQRPYNFGKLTYKQVTNGSNEFRFSPSYVFSLGAGFTLWGSVLGSINQNFMGYNKGDCDYFLESYVGLNYNFSKIFLSLIWFRGDKWYGEKSTTDRYVINQLRPSMKYFFGNGANIELAVRIPILDGEYYRQASTQTVQAQNYETRYTIRYTQPLFLGLSASISASLLDIEVKSLTNNTKYNYHSFRTSMGLTYNFGF